MKVRRYKHAKKVLSSYKNVFGFREPFQVIVDGTFCQAALDGKIQIKEQLPKYLGGAIQLVTTQCVIAEVESIGRELVGALYVAKRFQLRSCSHKKAKPAPATDCILSLIGEENPHHYFVATQDTELRGSLKKIPGVPLLNIVRNTIVLEGLSNTSRRTARDLNEGKADPSDYQHSVIEQLNSSAATGDATAAQRKGKRKRPKGPNPLSVRKSKRGFATSRPMPASSLVTSSKRRRLRLQRQKAVEFLAKVAQSHTT